jgi:hypothetical protein
VSGSGALDPLTARTLGPVATRAADPTSRK